jgi:hypothetical protein
MVHNVIRYMTVPLILLNYVHVSIHNYGCNIHYIILYELHKLTDNYYTYTAVDNEQLHI